MQNKKIIMIFEDLMKPNKMALLSSAIYTIVGIYIGKILFNSSLAMIFFSAMPISHYMYGVMKSKKRIKTRDLIKLYAYSFIGMAIVFGIGSPYMGKLPLGAVGNAYNPYMEFSSILLNNLKVMFICFSMSLLYGTGAIFILALNAAIAGKLFALLFSKNIEIAILYFPHTSVEIFAYFLGAISGGMLASAFIGSRKFDNDFGKAVLNSASVYTIGIAFVMLAAFLESFVLPMMLSRI